jgi:hypothetical protein
VVWFVCEKSPPEQFKVSPQILQSLLPSTSHGITKSAGTAICEWALNATSNPRKSVMCFPTQEQPSTSNVISTWKRVIQTSYSPAAFCTLDRPMGLWRKGKIAQVWNTVIDPNTGIVHIWQQGKVYMYEKRNWSQYRYLRLATNDAFPINSVPISGELHSGIFTTRGYSGIDKHHEPTPPYVRAFQTMNHRVMRNDTYKNIAGSIGREKP